MKIKDKYEKKPKKRSLIKNIINLQESSWKIRATLPRKIFKYDVTTANF